MASVRPLRGVARTLAAPRPEPAAARAEPAGAKRAPERMPARIPARAAPPPPRPAAANTLDGGWDKRLARGMVMPDVTIDLHGHTLASAHAVLDAGLDRAIRGGCRVILLVTGKPPRPESERPYARGAIRAAVADWIAASRHADGIAAVRGAHPRHGGQGALYIILRRPRG